MIGTKAEQIRVFVNAEGYYLEIRDLSSNIRQQGQSRGAPPLGTFNRLDLVVKKTANGSSPDLVVATVELLQNRAPFASLAAQTIDATATQFLVGLQGNPISEVSTWIEDVLVERQ